MYTTIRTRIIKIGDSQAIRIPKLLLERANIVGEVELGLQDKQIILRPARPARQGWEKAFQLMAAQGDDRLPVTEDLAFAHRDDEECE
jgi:antitoxin MazE